MLGGVADDRLHDETGERRRYPENRDIPQVGAEGLEYPADVGVLQTECELDPEKAHAHVPDLAERQLGLPGHGDCLAEESGAIRSAPMLALLSGPVAPPLATRRRRAGLTGASLPGCAVAGGAGGGPV